MDIRYQRLTEKMREGSEFLLHEWQGLPREREREFMNEFQELADKIREIGQSFGLEKQMTPEESLEQVLNRLGTFLEAWSHSKKKPPARIRHERKGGKRKRDSRAQVRSPKRVVAATPRWKDLPTSGGPYPTFPVSSRDKWTVNGVSGCSILMPYGDCLKIIRS